MEGKGRVFYTTMGHTAEIWQDPVFMQMLLGGIRWATRLVDADVTPDVAHDHARLYRHSAARQ